MPITPKVQARIPIPEPTNEPDSLWRTCQALKEAVEVMQGIRGNREYALKAELSAGTTTINNLSGGGGGTVTSSGVPLNNEVAVFTTATDIDSDASFTYDGTTLEATQFAGIAKANLLDKSATEIITLGVGGSWTFTGDGSGRVALDLGTDLFLESNDGTTNVIVNHNNADFRYSTTGARFNAIPFYVTGFLDFRLDEPIKIKEQATADPFVSTYGQLWVKTATPNELWFSDDAGTDFQLSGGGTGLGNVVEDLTPQLGGELDAQAFAVLDFTIKHQVVSSAATVLTVDYALGQSVLTTLTENIATFTINNWPATDLAQIEFEIIQDGVARTVAWPAAVEWVGGVPPDLSNLSSRNLVRLRTRNGGTNIMGTFGENFS